MGFKLSISLAKMLVSNDPRPISRTNIVKICVRHISTCFLIIRFHISDEYSTENCFLCLLKSCAKHSWTYITLCERTASVVEKLCKTPNYNLDLLQTTVNNFHMSILQFYFSNPIRGCLKKTIV
jgi:hypothetical protein